MAASWGENTWSSSGWGGYTLINGNSAAGAVGSLTASISITIGISRFLLEDGSGYLLLEDGSYLMEEAGTGPIPSINGAVGTVAQATALVGVVETSAVGSVTPSITVASTGVSATGNAGATAPALVGVIASGGIGSLTPSITVSIIPGAWGAGDWGSGAWGSATPAIAGAVGSNGVEIQVANTGVFATGSPSTVTPDKTFALSGVASLGNTGTVAPSITVSIVPGWGTGAWGSGAWGSATPAIAGAVGSNGVEIQVANTGDVATGNTGSVAVDRTAASSGVASSGNTGTVAPVIAVSINTGWGSGAWGSGAWGSDLAITGAVGSNGVAVQVASTGDVAAGQTGTIVYNRIEFITGVQELGAVGGVTPSTTITIGISRFLLEDGSGYLLLEDGSYLLEEASAGEYAGWGVSTWGSGVWGGSSTVINAAVGSVNQSYIYFLTGVASAANVGAVVPSTTVSLATSWGTGAWGSGTWGGARAAITGSVGSIAYSPTLIGVQASASVGRMTPSITVDIGISRFVLENGWGVDAWNNGVWGSNNIGYLLLEDGSYLMEEAGTGPIPSINGAVGTVAPATSVALDSKWGIGAWGANTWSSGLLIVGAVNEMIAVSPAIRGVRADGFAGTPVSNITVAITGAASQGAVGYLAVVRTALLSGVTATGSVGVLGVQKSYWDIIDDAENANWAEIDNAQTAAWAAISNAQNASWTQIPNAQSPGWGAVSDAQTAGWELIPTAFDQN